MLFLRQVFSIVRKDLVTELRSGEILSSMALFSLLLVLVFSFAFVRDGSGTTDTAAGVIWVTLAFSGTLGLSRAFDRERRADGLRAMLMSPASRTAIYAAKVILVLLFMTATAVLVVPLIGLLFGAPIFPSAGRLALLLLLGILGFSLVGAFFGSLMARGQSGELLLFIILYPLLFPVLIAGVLGTAELLSEEPREERVALFTSLLLAFDALVAVIACWSFGRLIVD